MWAENQAAVGAATAATLLCELAKLSNTAASDTTGSSVASDPSSVPPVLMLASMGANWTVHACFAETINGHDEYHIYQLSSTIDLTDEMQNFNFQVVLSRIRELALSVIKPWLTEQIARLVPHANAGECVGVQTRSSGSTTTGVGGVEEL